MVNCAARFEVSEGEDLNPGPKRVSVTQSFFFLFSFIYLLYNIVLVLPYIDMNPPWLYMCSPSWTPPPTSLPIPSLWVNPVSCIILYHALTLDWRFVSHVIIYMFQCHSPISSYSRPLPQSPKDCSIHLCLFFCLTYRVIVTIFQNFIYMC